MESLNEVIVVYFLPILLFEMGPDGDGARVLARFTASSSISQRVIHPPATVGAKFERYFKGMAQEFNQGKPGSELGIRVYLMKALVELLRWERVSGDDFASPAKHLRLDAHRKSPPLYLPKLRATALSG